MREGERWGSKAFVFSLRSRLVFPTPRSPSTIIFIYLPMKLNDILNDNMGVLRFYCYDRQLLKHWAFQIYGLILALISKVGIFV